jgi:hypothetical protein
MIYNKPVNDECYCCAVLITRVIPGRGARAGAWLMITVYCNNLVNCVLEGVGGGAAVG